MIRTSLCDTLGIDRPIILGGMGSGTTPALVAAVSEAGGLGTLGLNARPADAVAPLVAKVREATAKPFGVNFLMFNLDEAAFAAALEARPQVLSLAWARPDQELARPIARAHDAGGVVMYNVGNVKEARRAAEAGADIIVAQGTEGGGHVGWMGTLPLVPMVVDAVAPKPVVAAGGIADGRGLAAVLALGAQGVLLGTRFLATDESPLHPNFKAAIVESDGHDTELAAFPDTARGQLWPGAMARVRRNAFYHRWAGREWAAREAQAEITAGLNAARESGNADEALLLIGQDAGLIHEVLPAGDVVRQIAADAEAYLGRMAGLPRR